MCQVIEWAARLKVPPWKSANFASTSWLTCMPHSGTSSVMLSGCQTCQAATMRQTWLWVAKQDGHNSRKFLANLFPTTSKRCVSAMWPLFQPCKQSWTSTPKHLSTGTFEWTICCSARRPNTMRYWWSISKGLLKAMAYMMSRTCLAIAQKQTFAENMNATSSNGTQTVLSPPASKTTASKKPGMITASVSFTHGRSLL